MDILMSSYILALSNPHPRAIYIDVHAVLGIYGPYQM